MDQLPEVKPLFSQLASVAESSTEELVQPSELDSSVRKTDVVILHFLFNCLVLIDVHLEAQTDAWKAQACKIKYHDNT